MEIQKTKHFQSNDEQKEFDTDGQLILSDFKNYNKSVLIRKVQDWHKDWKTDQKNQIDKTEVELYLHDQLIFETESKAA